MRTLAITVHVHDPETGSTKVLNRGTQVDAKTAALIGNPDVWEDDDADEAETAHEGTGEPPRAGAGSGREVWAKFAADRGVHVDDEDKRDDIIAALVDAGVIDE